MLLSFITCSRNLSDSSGEISEIDEEVQGSTEKVEDINHRIETIKSRVENLKKVAQELRENATRVQEMDVSGKLPNNLCRLTFMNSPLTFRNFSEFNILLCNRILCLVGGYVHVIV